MNVGVNSADEVIVSATLSTLDGAGQPILGLGNNNFIIRQNGVRIDSPLTISPVQESIAVSLIIDRELSMVQPEPNGLRPLDRAREAAEFFLTTNLKNGDQVSVSIYDDKIIPVQPSIAIDEAARIGTINALRTNLNYDPIDGHPCLMYQAIDYALQGLQTNRSSTRQAVILLTDQRSPSCPNDLRKIVIDQAYGENIPLFFIGLNDEIDQSLSEMIQHTGGKYLINPDLADLKSFFAALEGQLRSQYLLNFPVDSAGEEQIIEIIIEANGIQASTTRNITFDTPALLPLMTSQMVQPDENLTGAEVAVGPIESSATESNSLGIVIIFVLALGLLIGSGIWLIKTHHLFPPGGSIFSLQPGTTVIDHLPLRNFNPHAQTAHLVVLEGPEDIERRLPISKVKTTIGRNWARTSISNDININDLTISRTHAEIIYDFEKREAGYQIRDVSDRNRVGINGLEIEKNEAVTLKNNDVIEIGDVVLRFELTGPGEPKAPELYHGQAGVDYDGQKTETIIEVE